MKTNSMTQIGLFAAIICIFAPISINISSAVPISLATFAIYLAVITLGTGKAVYAVVIYILLGLIGLPVFSGYSGGVGKLLGVTGGYIIGYIPCVLVSGLMADKLPMNKLKYPVALLVGTAVLYAFGTFWYVLQTGNGVYESLAACVLQFIPGDIIKITVASLASGKLKAYDFSEIR